MKTGVEVIFARVCGLDVHRDSVTACVRIVEPDNLLEEHFTVWLVNAIKHSLLVTFYYMLRDAQPYRDLGPNRFRTINAEQQIRYHLRRLERLGQKVQVIPVESAA